MMGVHVDIAAREQIEIVQPVARERVQHVREERHLRVDGAYAGAVEPEGDADLRFGGVAFDRDASHYGALYTTRVDVMAVPARPQSDRTSARAPAGRATSRRTSPT